MTIRKGHLRLVGKDEPSVEERSAALDRDIDLEELAARIYAAYLSCTGEYVSMDLIYKSVVRKLKYPIGGDTIWYKAARELKRLTPNVA